MASVKAVEAAIRGSATVVTGASATRASAGELATFAGVGGGTGGVSDSQQQHSVSGPQQQHEAEPTWAPGHSCSAGAGTGRSTNTIATRRAAQRIE